MLISLWCCELKLLAGLPVSTDDIPAEDQLMLLGMAQDNDEAMAMVAGSNRPPPQLYSGKHICHPQHVYGMH